MMMMFPLSYRVLGPENEMKADVRQWLARALKISGNLWINNCQLTTLQAIVRKLLPR